MEILLVLQILTVYLLLGMLFAITMLKNSDMTASNMDIWEFLTVASWITFYTFFILYAAMVLVCLKAAEQHKE